MRFLPRFLIVVTFVVALGCGKGGSGSGSTTGPTANDKALDVARMLKDFGDANRRAPNGLQEMADYDATHPAGFGAVSSKEYVVFWRAPISATAGNTVLAYEKDVPTKGGAVVMQDGSVKEMTAAEFNAAPKAGK